MFAIAKLKRLIYITGGNRFSLSLNTTMILNSETNTLQEDGPEMNQERYNHSSTALGTSLYVFGGMSVGRLVATIEVLDTREEE